MIKLKLKSFNVDVEKGITSVLWHEWDGKYFCAKCALDCKSGDIIGVTWNSPDEVLQAVKETHYGNNI